MLTAQEQLIEHDQDNEQKNKRPNRKSNGTLQTR